MNSSRSLGWTLTCTKECKVAVLFATGESNGRRSFKYCTYYFKEVESSVVLFQCCVDHSSIVIVAEKIFGIIMSSL